MLISARASVVLNSKLCRERTVDFRSTVWPWSTHASLFAFKNIADATVARFLSSEMRSVIFDAVFRILEKKNFPSKSFKSRVLSFFLFFFFHKSRQRVKSAGWERFFPDSAEGKNSEGAEGSSRQERIYRSGFPANTEILWLFDLWLFVAVLVFRLVAIELE